MYRELSLVAAIALWDELGLPELGDQTAVEVVVDEGISHRTQCHERPRLQRDGTQQREGTQILCGEELRAAVDAGALHSCVSVAMAKHSGVEETTAGVGRSIAAHLHQGDLLDALAERAEEISGVDLARNAFAYQELVSRARSGARSWMPEAAPRDAALRSRVIAAMGQVSEELAAREERARERWEEAGVSQWCCEQLSQALAPGAPEGAVVVVECDEVLLGTQELSIPERGPERMAYRYLTERAQVHVHAGTPWREVSIVPRFVADWVQRASDRGVISVTACPDREIGVLAAKLWAPGADGAEHTLAGSYQLAQHCLAGV